MKMRAQRKEKSDENERSIDLLKLSTITEHFCLVDVFRKVAAVLDFLDKNFKY